MKAIILDANQRFFKTYKGNLEKNKFKYKVPFFPKPFDFIPMPFLEQFKEIPCDSAKRIDAGKEWLAIYSFNGEEYSQLDFKQGRDFNISAFLQNVEIGNYAKNLGLKKPFEIGDLAQAMAIFLICAIGITAYLTLQNLQTSIGNSLAPFKNQTQLLAHQIALQNNETIQLYQIYNKTYRFMVTHIT